MSDDADRVRDEFFAESQEIVESLSRDLLLLDHGQKEGKTDPELVNSVFRGVHTLKGVAGMFGFGDLSEASHHLEDLLDQVRLGRVSLSQVTLDVLFEGVEILQRLLGAARGEAHEVDVEAFARAIRNVLSQPQVERSDALSSLDLDAGVLSVLTEYEEHRLRANVEAGIALFRLRASFELMTIDTDLESLKQRVKSFAEIVTYLPSADAGDEGTLEIVILIASRRSLAQLREALEGSSVVADEVARRDIGGTVPPPSSGRSEESFSLRAPPLPRIAPSVAPGALGAEGGLALAARGGAKTVRVDIEKLDHLMNVVGELGIVKSGVLRLLDRLGARPELRTMVAELHRIERTFERHLASLQEGILDVRMVPLGQTFDRLGRAVRQAARERDKDVRLVVTGADTEVDKLIVEELVDPLLHIIRNAVDHGIERADLRHRAGKAPTGTLALNAYQKGNHVVIEVEDDGGGIDPNRVLARAIVAGLTTEALGSEMTEAEIRQFIFVPGFSTALEVTDLSGRGVGMDVVKTNIGRLGGVVDVQSTVGIGTKFTLTLPITLAIVSALILRVRTQAFAIPLSVVHEALFLDERSVRRVEGREVITLRGESLPIARLATLFGLAGEPERRGYVVVTALGQRRLGLVVDALEAQEDIITKPLGASLADVVGFSGATDLGDQRVVLVIDASAILDEVLSSGAERQFIEAPRLGAGPPS